MDGKAHSLMTVTAGLSLPVGFATGYILQAQQVPSLIIGTFFGLLLNSDADVDAGNISDYYIRKLFGTDLIYDIWLKPYRKSIKHRSFWSHTPIIGTIVRILYILLPITIFLFKDQPTKTHLFVLNLLFAQLIGVGLIIGLFLLNEYVNVWYWVYPAILGLSFADTLHFLADTFG